MVVILVVWWLPVVVGVFDSKVRWLQISNIFPSLSLSTHHPKSCGLVLGTESLAAFNTVTMKKKLRFMSYQIWSAGRTRPYCITFALATYRCVLISDSREPLHLALSASGTILNSPALRCKKRWNC